jgi:hypothetical protein
MPDWMRISCARLSTHFHGGAVETPHRLARQRRGYAVEQYMDGELVETYDSLYQASVAIGKSHGYLGEKFQRTGKTTIEASGYIYKLQRRITSTIIQRDKKLTELGTYDSTNAASLATGIPSNNIRQCLAGRCKTSGGYVWEYKEE